MAYRRLMIFLRRVAKSCLRASPLLSVRFGLPLCFVLLSSFHSPRSVLLSATIQKRQTTVQFIDVTSNAGIKWHLKQLASGPKYLVEPMGGGGGFIDYN